MRIQMIATAFAATLLAGPAFAQDAPPPPHPGGMMIMADANKDGIVTRAEILADVDIRFGRADINHDGRITADEHGAGPRGERMGGRRGERRMARRHREDGPRPDREARPRPGDTNNDGALTLEEARAQALKVFAYIDRNNDGRIDTAERDAMRETMMAMRGPGGPRGRHGPPPPDAPAAPQGN